MPHVKHVNFNKQVVRSIVDVSGSRLTANHLWYNQHIDLYREFTKKVEDLIKDLLNEQRINYHTINSRTKEFKSFRQKLAGKQYNNPKEMTDLAGVRVIGYILSDIQNISDIIEDHFEIDWQRSGNRPESEEENRGYKSRHLIASVPEERTNLPEWEKFKGLCFEIQIRTILQHAWAEIEHDRNYKFAGKLPTKIPEEFYKIADALNRIDRKFERISKGIERYSADVSDKIDKQQLNIQINYPSLRNYLIKRFGDIPYIKAQFFGLPGINAILSELNSMGIKSLADLDKIIPNNFKEVYSKAALRGSETDITFPSIIRDILILHDHKKYFSKVWKKKRWDTVGSQFMRVIEAYGLDSSILPKGVKVDCY
jgi:putative GTP pyrophosphokinase